MSFHRNAVFYLEFIGCKIDLLQNSEFYKEVFNNVTGSNQAY